jgi:DNA-binding HxlR family transcriptional regulator
LTANTVNGSRNGARSGALALVLLAAPLNAPILRALEAGPRKQVELRRETGAPAQTTLRAQLKKLVEIGAIAKQRRDLFPGVLEYELTGSGRDLLFVADTLERWLGHAPEGPLALGGIAAKSAIKALAEGWSSTVLRGLAAGPLSLTELNRLISAFSYPSLERRLAAMRLAGQIQACPANGRGTPYAVTEWLRRAVAPLASAIRWERLHQTRSTAPVARLDAETAFLLAIPLLQPTAGLSGSCRIAMEIPNGKPDRLSGVTVEVRAGKVISCVTRSHDTPTAWALGSPSAWLDAVIEHDADRLELSGDSRLASALLSELHGALFGGSLDKSTIEP